MREGGKIEDHIMTIVTGERSTRALKILGRANIRVINPSISQTIVPRTIQGQPLGLIDLVENTIGDFLRDARSLGRPDVVAGLEAAMPVVAEADSEGKVGARLQRFARSWIGDHWAHQVIKHGLKVRWKKNRPPKIFQGRSQKMTPVLRNYSTVYPGDVTIKGHHWHLGEGAHLPDFFCETEGFSERQSNPRFKETKQTNSLPVL